MHPPFTPKVLIRKSSSSPCLKGITVNLMALLCLNPAAAARKPQSCWIWIQCDHKPEQEEVFEGSSVPSLEAEPAPALQLEPPLPSAAGSVRPSSEFVPPAAAF